MDFAEEIWGYEPRFLYKADGTRFMYQESWLVADDIQKFIDVNEQIYLDTQNFNLLNLLYVGNLIESYKKERFSSVLPKS